MSLFVLYLIFCFILFFFVPLVFCLVPPTYLIRPHPVSPLPLYCSPSSAPGIQLSTFCLPFPVLLSLVIFAIFLVFTSVQPPVSQLLVSSPCPLVCTRNPGCQQSTREPPLHALFARVYFHFGALGDQHVSSRPSDLTSGRWASGVPGMSGLFPPGLDLNVTGAIPHGMVVVVTTTPTKESRILASVNHL